MQRAIASYITGIASLSFIFTAIQFEKVTSLSSRWERPENRKLIEERVTLNQTSTVTGKTNERAVESNVSEIGKYSGQYKCASGKDASKCLPARKK